MDLQTSLKGQEETISFSEGRSLLLSQLVGLIGPTRQGNPKMSLRDELPLYQDVLGGNVTPLPMQSVPMPLLLSREFL